MNQNVSTLKKFSRGNSNTNQVDYSALQMGKMAPRATDLEEAVLGACMIEKEALDVIIDILKEPEVFYSDANQRIYKAIKQLYGSTKPIDILTVADQLRSNGELEAVGGAYYLAELTNRVASAANIEYHARIVAQKYIQRELIRVSGMIVQEAFEDTTDVFQLLDKAEQNLFNIAENNLRKNGEEISGVIMKEIKSIGERMQRATEGNVLTGVGTGFRDLDKMTSGWQKSDLIIIAARPGMGKTSFTLALARNSAVELQKPVAFFSLEMSTGQLVQRLISMETELSADKLRKGTLEHHEYKQLTTKIDKLKSAQIIIDDTPALNVFELRAKCRRYKERFGIEMIIIDYLQLMTGGTDGKTNFNREQEISQISRSLKTIAKELNVPVIALSQLNRSVETRGGMKRPQLSDLRESGAIEQDADIVIFLYRAEYYKIDQDEAGDPTRGIGEVIIAKHRNGELGTVKTKFIGQYAKFAELDGWNADSILQNEYGKQEDQMPRNTAFKTYRSRMDEEIGGDADPLDVF